jgi:GMP synthase-like glutamine amidotransferase
MSIPDKPLRIAILEADHPLKNTAERWGTYGGVFTNLLQNAATSLGWNVISTLNVTKWDIERHQNFPPSLDSIDGILITGSRASAFDDTPWIVALVEYVRTALSIPKSKRRVKIIGVCFGHQIVARALGCTVDRSENGWEASVTKFLLSDAGCEIFGKDVLVFFILPSLFFCSKKKNTSLT